MTYLHKIFSKHCDAYTPEPHGLALPRFLGAMVTATSIGDASLLPEQHQMIAATYAQTSNQILLQLLDAAVKFRPTISYMAAALALQNPGIDPETLLHFMKIGRRGYRDFRGRASWAGDYWLYESGSRNSLLVRMEEQDPVRHEAFMWSLTL